MNISKYTKIKFITLIILMLVFAMLFSGCAVTQTEPGVYVDIKTNGTTQMILIYDLEDTALLNAAADEVSVLIPVNLLPAEQQINDLLKGYFRKKDIKFKSFDVFTTYYRVVLAPESVKPIQELDNIYPGVDLGTSLTLNKSDMFLAPVSVITPIVMHTEIALVGVVSAKTSDMFKISESMLTGKTQLSGEIDYNDIMVVYHQTYSLIDRMLMILIGIILFLTLCLFVVKFIKRNQEEKL